MAGSRVCHNCGAAWEGVRVEFRAVCVSCGEYLHVCLNCRHHDPVSYHECRASASTEYVGDKKGANFCEEFEFRAGGGKSDGGVSRAEAEKFFKDLP